MSVESNIPEHPFNQAMETWNAWSRANVMRFALQRARELDDNKTLASFQQYPDWTRGPDALEALGANHQLVSLLESWRWQAIREAREQGGGWHEIGEALDLEPMQARSAYLERLDRQRAVAERNPDVGRLIGYDPALAVLADDNQADRAWQQRSAQPEREGGHER
jgi:hypothetical protein